MSLHKAISDIRLELQNRGLKKSGKNKFAGFEYFELSDFLPTLNELMNDKEVNDVFSITEDSASLTLIKDENREVYAIPFTHYQTPVNKQGTPSMQDIQYLGALITYYKRYLYMNAFGITDGEVVDAMEMPTVPQRRTYNTWSKASDDDKLRYKKEFMVACENDGVSKDSIQDFLDFVSPGMDEKAKFNEIVHFLRQPELLSDQLESYKNYVIKQASA